MQCPKCNFNGIPKLKEVKMHTKATCPECGTYIKMVSRAELDEIMDDTNNEITLVIKTKAGDNYMPDILGRIAISLKKGYLCGEGIIIKPFNDESYTYEFYYGPYA